MSADSKMMKGHVPPMQGETDSVNPIPAVALHKATALWTNKGTELENVIYTEHINKLTCPPAPTSLLPQ